MPIYELQGTLYNERFTFNTQTMRIEREHDVFEGAYTRDLRIDAKVPLTKEIQDTLHFDQMKRNTVTNERDAQGNPLWFAVVFATTDPVYKEGVVYFKYAGKRA